MGFNPVYCASMVTEQTVVVTPTLIKKKFKQYRHLIITGESVIVSWILLIFIFFPLLNKFVLDTYFRYSELEVLFPIFLFVITYGVICALINGIIVFFTKRKLLSSIFSAAVFLILFLGLPFLIVFFIQIFNFIFNMDKGYFVNKLKIT